MAFLLCFFVSFALASSPPLLELGEQLDGVTVTSRQAHSEFIRYKLKLTNGSLLVVELQPSNRAGNPACTHNKVSLTPRWELLNQSLSKEQQPPFINTICSRLSKTAIQFMKKAPTKQSSQPPLPKNQQVTTHTAFTTQFFLFTCIFLALWNGLSSLMLRRRNDYLSLTGIFIYSLGTRLILSKPHIFNGDEAGYEKIILSWGHRFPNQMYGDGMTALMQPIYSLFGYQPEVLFTTNLVLSASAPLVLWTVLQQLQPQKQLVANVAAMGLASLPILIKVSSTEIFTIPLVFFTLLLVSGSLSYSRSPSVGSAILVWTSYAVTLQFRPEALGYFVLPLLICLLWTQEHRWKRLGYLTLPLGILLLLRLNSLDIVHGMSIAWGGGQEHGTFSVLQVVSAWTLLDWNITPPVYVLLAFLGMMAKYRKASLIMICWALIVGLPIIAKNQPMADAIRLQLPMFVPIMGLIGLSVTTQTRFQQILKWILPTGLLLVPLWYQSWIQKIWITQAEYQYLRTALRELPQKSQVGIHSQERRSMAKRYLFSYLYPKFEWVPLTHSKDWFWSPVDCFQLPTCQHLLQSCSLHEGNTWQLPSYTDQDIQLPTKKTTIGLYQQQNCTNE